MVGVCRVAKIKNANETAPDYVPMLVGESEAV